MAKRALPLVLLLMVACTRMLVTRNEPSSAGPTAGDSAGSGCETPVTHTPGYIDGSGYCIAFCPTGTECVTTSQVDGSCDGEQNCVEVLGQANDCSDSTDSCITVGRYAGFCDTDLNCVPGCDPGALCYALSGVTGSCDSSINCVEGLSPPATECDPPLESDPLGADFAVWGAPAASSDVLSGICWDSGTPEPSADCDTSFDGYCTTQADPPPLANPASSAPTNPWETSTWSFTPGATADITSVLDKGFVTALQNFTCPANPETANWGTVYYEGIQAYDPNRDYGWQDALGGDRATADAYNRYALQGANNPRSNIRYWYLFSYFNIPTLTSAAGTTPGTGYTTTALANSDPLRYPVRTPAGNLVTPGDQLSARMMGIWVGTPNNAGADINADFRHGQPQFLAPAAAQRRQDQTDFTAYVPMRVSTPQWARFIYTAAWFHAISMKCGYPALAHSGGGVIVNFVHRLLAAHPGVSAILAAAPVMRYVIVGLEDVISQQVVALLAAQPAYSRNGVTRSLILNYLSGTIGDNPQGSATWRNPIVREIENSGYTAYVTNFAGNIGRWFSGPHAGVGFYPLVNGRMPNAQLPHGH